MKILILQDDFPPHSAGGAGIIAYNLAKEFKKSGHDVLVVTAAREQHLASREILEGIEIVRIFSAYHERWQAYLSLYNPQVVPTLKKIMKEYRPDIVHAHNVHGHLSYHSLKIAAQSGARVFLTAHDAMLFNYGKARDDKKVSALELIKKYRLRYNPFRNICIRRYLRYVKHIIAVSNALKQALNNNGIERVSVIHNGIDAQLWAESAGDVAAFKNKHGLGGNVILFGGRLSGAKGGEKIVKALAGIVSAVPDVQLLIMGKKDLYADRMLAHAQKEGIGDRIVFTGWISGGELHQTYHSASVVVVPSIYFDPFPTMNLEGMACRKPVVATCFGGSREAVVDGETGYIINPFDVPAMVGKLVELLMDKEKNKAFGEAGYERVVKDFSLAQQAVAYERLFIEKLL